MTWHVCLLFSSRAWESAVSAETCHLVGALRTMCLCVSHFRSVFVRHVRSFWPLYPMVAMRSHLSLFPSVFIGIRTGLVFCTTATVVTTGWRSAQKFAAVVHIRFSVVYAHVCPPKRSLRFLVGCPRHAVVGLYIGVKAGLHVMAELKNVHIVLQRRLRSCPSKCGSGRGVEVPPPEKNGGSTTRSGDGREEYSPSPR